MLLGAFQERAALDCSRETAQKKIEQWKAENPEEAKKIAETVKKKEAAARKKAAAQSGKPLPDAMNGMPVVTATV